MVTTPYKYPLKCLRMDTFLQLMATCTAIIPLLFRMDIYMGMVMAMVMVLAMGMELEEVGEEVDS